MHDTATQIAHLICLPDGMSHQPSAGTGTGFRPSILRDHAQRAHPTVVPHAAWAQCRVEPAATT